MASNYFKELSERTGLSEDMVRRVMTEAKQILVDELVENKGYLVNLPGIASYYYKEQSSLQVGGGYTKKVLVRCSPSTSIASAIEKKLYANKEVDSDEDKSHLLYYEDVNSG